MVDSFWDTAAGQDGFNSGGQYSGIMGQSFGGYGVDNPYGIVGQYSDHGYGGWSAYGNTYAYGAGGLADDGEGQHSGRIGQKDGGNGVSNAYGDFGVIYSENYAGFDSGYGGYGIPTYGSSGAGFSASDYGGSSAYGAGGLAADGASSGSRTARRYHPYRQ